MSKFHATIVGLPRSRTFWFSELLTHGDYHCFHDYHSYRYPPIEGKILLNSTPNPLTPIEGNTVVIIRDMKAAERSLLRFLEDPDEEFIREAIELVASRLHLIDGYRVRYEDINTNLPQILKHLDVEIPITRAKEFVAYNRQSKDTCEAKSPYPYR